MSVRKTLVALLALSMLVLAQACERTITQVVQNEESSLNCFECHSDENTFLVAAEEQWMNSVHASGHNINRATRSSCAPCHGSEGFIQFTGGEEVTGGNNPTVIHCFTCHAPHTTGDFGMRVTAIPTLANGDSFDLGSGNTCVTCHQARRGVEDYVGTDGDAAKEITSTHWGPHHSSQGDMLIGTNGYEYSGFDYDTAGHRSATENGCVDCHMTLGTSNNVVGGHAFNMRWEVIDHDGLTEEILNTGACEGCHGDMDDYNYNDAQDEIAGLLDDLEILLEAEGVFHDGHPVEDAVTTVDGAGALWNYQMVAEDRSLGVHNTNYARVLLKSAIAFLEGASAPVGPLAEK